MKHFDKRDLKRKKKFSGFPDSKLLVLKMHFLFLTIYLYLKTVTLHRPSRSKIYGSQFTKFKNFLLYSECLTDFINSVQLQILQN